MGRLKELAQSGIHFCVGLDLEPYGEAAGWMRAGCCACRQLCTMPACLHEPGLASARASSRDACAAYSDLLLLSCPYSRQARL